MESNIIKIINETMTDIVGEDNWNKIKNIMNETGTIISGSFILQCIMNKTWTESDIDFYAPLSDITSPHDNPSSPLDEFLASLYKMTSYIPNYRYNTDVGGGLAISFVREFNINTKKIQTMTTTLNKDELQNFIKDKFDFDVCKNIYSIHDNVEKLYIDDIDSITAKKIIWKFNGNIKGTLKRTIKYIDRGFEIVFPSNFMDLCEQNKIISIAHYNTTTLNNTILTDYEQYEHYEKTTCSEKLCIFNKLNKPHYHIEYGGSSYKNLIYCQCECKSCKFIFMDVEGMKISKFKDTKFYKNKYN